MTYYNLSPTYNGTQYFSSGLSSGYSSPLRTIVDVVETRVTTFELPRYDEIVSLERIRHILFDFSLFDTEFNRRSNESILHKLSYIFPKMKFYDRENLLEDVLSIPNEFKSSNIQCIQVSRSDGSLFTILLKDDILKFLQSCTSKLIDTITTTVGLKEDYINQLQEYIKILDNLYEKYSQDVKNDY